jgi:hypothetical protein
MVRRSSSLAPVSQSITEHGEGDVQVNIRLSPALLDWLQQRAGSRRGVAGFIRQLIEECRQTEHDVDLLEMFNAAARDLTAEDRDERRQFMRAHPGRR